MIHHQTAKVTHPELLTKKSLKSTKKATGSYRRRNLTKEPPRYKKTGQVETKKVGCSMTTGLVRGDKPSDTDVDESGLSG